MNVSATDLLIQGVQELLYRGAAIEAHDLIRAVEKMHRYGMRQRMVVRILHQYRQHLHPRWFHFSTTVLQRSLQSSLAVSRVLATFRPVDVTM